MGSTAGLEGIPQRLWHLIRLARHRLLMVDYDGTLAPFTADRDRAVPLPRVVEWLRRIAADGRTTVAVVSGRPLAELERLLERLPVLLVGEHGWDHGRPGGESRRHPLPGPVAHALDACYGGALAAGLEEAGLERKRTAIVLHTRGLPEERAREMERRVTSAWQRVAAAAGLVVDRIDGGVEVRARSRNKGTVVLELLGEAPPGTLGVYVGDDITDEDAFEAVRDWGFGIRVGAVDRPSQALARVASCAEVALFLEEWLQVVGTASDDGGRAAT
jgi:trehalose-phosphatase